MRSIVRKLSPLTPPHRLFPLSFSLSAPNSCSILSSLLPCPLPSPAVSSAANHILSLLRHFASQPSPSSTLSLAFIRDGCYDAEVAHRPPFSLLFCPGCGVHMQNSDPSLPGFFSTPSTKSPDYPLPLSSTSDPETSIFIKSGHLQELSEATGGPLPGDSSAEDSKPLVCARCHSLRHYGRVKDSSAENLLPDFDFDCMIAPKIASPSGPRSVVLFVVDSTDFDGSFPRKVSRLLSTSIDHNALAWKESKSANIPRIILVVTKLDLLPSSVSQEMLNEWTRRRANILGAVKLAGLHLVSAVRDWGVRNLVEQVAEFAGPRGNVWAVGAQNAGKSTLINAMGRCVGRKMTQLTEAPVPGTTLGIVRVEGVLCGHAKLFDTPGILHPYQITTRLTREEQKLIHISKELKPRTYRIKVSFTYLFIFFSGTFIWPREELSKRVCIGLVV
ncbi:NO-associated protein 1, chloroplastic/mitochondrial [Dendrobium catenatum]|uniref:NO-associated protein 1, chloroplastic/mitochondrial n=2 Tax=Dendrobium catenatum TaxID=906689 RepID=A0A2I0X5U4_9ASPA|nr:NO-associated protein 1, chloroplastic/mitochondrial [Dendrobium catenatum]